MNKIIGHSNRAKETLSLRAQGANIAHGWNFLNDNFIAICALHALAKLQCREPHGYWIVARRA